MGLKNEAKVTKLQFHKWPLEAGSKASIQLIQVTELNLGLVPSVSALGVNFHAMSI